MKCCLCVSVISLLLNGSKCDDEDYRLSPVYHRASLNSHDGCMMLHQRWTLVVRVRKGQSHSGLVRATPHTWLEGISSQCGTNVHLVKRMNWLQSCGEISKVKVTLACFYFGGIHSVWLSVIIMRHFFSHNRAKKMIKSGNFISKEP